MSSSRGFWRASPQGWRGGGHFSGSHGRRPTHNQESLPCRHFQRGACSYGARCRFSHDRTRDSGTTRDIHASDEPETLEQAEARTAYFDWKRLLRLPPSLCGNSLSSLARFWEDARGILDGDGRDWHQMLVRDLVDETSSSRQYINATIALDALTEDRTRMCIADDFIRVMAHESLLDCLSVGTYVGELYHIVGGVNGAEALDFVAKFWKAMLSYYKRMYAPEDIEPSLQRTSALVGELLRRRQLAALQGGLTEVLVAMDGVADLLNSPETASLYAACTDRIATLRRMVQLSATRLTAAADPSNGRSGPADPTAARPTFAFPIELELPTGRHDNDHLDIGRIKIYPTVDEILSTRDDFLPSTDFRQPHFYDDPVQRYLDTHFRLFRHDTFRPFVDFLHQALLLFTDGATPLHVLDGNIRAYVYHNATISHLLVEDKRGFESHVSFSSPHHLRQKSASERQAWWEQSKRLEQGTMACFICAVGGRPTPLLLIVTEKSTNPSEENNLVSEAHRGTISTKLATPERKDLELLTRIYHHRINGILIDLPDLIPATFKPILENLQDMMLNMLPFRTWILPDLASTRSPSAAIPPPRYARGAGFAFRLDSIVQDRARSLTLGTTASKSDAALLDRFVAEAGLDRGQAAAFVAALTTEYALLQGPPGTGKSYLGVKLLQVLLACKHSASLGSIIVICYTNHALDQFLQHLRAVGISRIIRIGGRSQSEDLNDCNLAEVSRRTLKFRSESRILGMAYSELDEQRRCLGHRLAGLHALRKEPPSTILKRFLERNRAQTHAQFFPDEQEGFVTVGDPVSIWLGRSWCPFSVATTAAATEEVLEDLGRRATRDVKSLSRSERRLLYQSWLDEIRMEQTDSLYEEIRHTEAQRSRIDAVHNETNRRVLLNANVIGITTTGLAKDVATLRHLRAKVVICEEAAEVLEPHLISALMPGVEHVIQIGDHQQLRPQITCRALSMEEPSGELYQLDRSQFERLAVGQPGLPPLPVAQLNVQRRMRPEISQLIRQTMYPRLEDHDMVKHLPNVVGMRNNVFWLTHDHSEDVADDDKRLKSHGNEWEVRMVLALVRHLVLQGAYKTTDIAVLTPYARQLQQLRAALAHDFAVFLGEKDEDILARNDIDGAEDASQTLLETKKLVNAIRLATVDNFQGEEAKVVIVSLVRSNSRRKVGFLKTSNRINVLLSRAQHGMYLIGNSDTYSNVDMWVEVRRQLEASNSIGTAFELCCPRHVDTPIRCSEPDDFARFSPDGGCDLPCDRRLDDCGHQCSARCHSETMHNAFACIQRCPRIRATCTHSCPRLCGEACGPCQVPVSDVPFPCGHRVEKLRCYQTLDVGKISCKVRVYRKVPGCGHVVEVACAVDVTTERFECPTPCEKVLHCGHKCPGSCGKCVYWDSDDVYHQQCSRKCGRPYDTCGHVCQSKCHSGQPCTPCARQCEVRCAHSRCSLPCQQACHPCIEKCTWSCEHQGDCPMPCAAPCTRLPCNERCRKILKCGHQCPSICGETCPEGYCQACGQHTAARVDLFELKDYRDIDLDETPIVVLGCDHFFTAESLDGSVRMNEVYAADPLTGHYSSLRKSQANLSVPSCPNCKQPIRQFATKRYGRAINQAVMDEISSKFHVNGLRKLAELESRIQDIADTLRNSRSGLHLPMRRFQSDETLYSEAETLKRDIGQFCRKIGAEQQPTKKLLDAVRLARRHGNEGLDGVMAALSLDDPSLPAPALDKQIILGGTLARLKLEDIVLADSFFAESRRVDALSVLDSAPRLEQKAPLFLRECKVFIEECRQENLPRMEIQAIAAYARVAKCLESFRRRRPAESPSSSASSQAYVDIARDLLETASGLCKVAFEGAKELQTEIEQISRLYERERYEPVTADEIAAIKSAMVSGAAGIATHSGHWYRCRNGRTFAIGECGMPMERARCPECQAPVGGQNHMLAEGVSRDIDMEQ
ncbi:hypothetical protein GGTG_13333 [Gaeumannomyces tritici R3-111a-1]|uniref:Uncharacterized protein n=1 Tax=Gaeumannomyces tritici (strain R3-111a-1) TaxID=644352 RepID=J3PIK4_GAET3|nr:hypothetical protein GGTG_13333 [Gaeumannomyces tritici R3-111a-1]EJT69065.1 hypothetical protein GGTG_13333 [Gaeumannomyces tritici R3-111a-1]